MFNNLVNRSHSDMFGEALVAEAKSRLQCVQEWGINKETELAKNIAHLFPTPLRGRCKVNGGHKLRGDVMI